jgi:hypothetical protein
MENAVRYCLAIVRLFPNLRASIIVRLTLPLLPHIAACFIQEWRRMPNTGYAVAVKFCGLLNLQVINLNLYDLAELQQEPDLGRLLFARI